MCASVGCGSLCDAQVSMYRDVNRALLFCHSRIDLPFPNPWLFRKVVAQFVGLVNNNK